MAIGDPYVFSGFLTPVLTQNLSFQSQRLLFSHASAEVRGENTPERKFALTGDRTHNHQVLSSTRSPQSHPVGALSTEVMIITAISKRCVLGWIFYKTVPCFYIPPHNEGFRGYTGISLPVRLSLRPSVRVSASLPNISFFQSFGRGINL